jgi:hypothetical protein
MLLMKANFLAGNFIVLVLKTGHQRAQLISQLVCAIEQWKNAYFTGDT